MCSTVVLVAITVAGGEIVPFSNLGSIWGVSVVPLLAHLFPPHQSASSSKEAKSMVVL